MHGRRDMWLSLWWNMADGDVTKYNQIKALDITEFWPFYDKWKEKVEREHKSYKNKNLAHGK